MTPEVEADLKMRLRGLEFADRYMEGLLRLGEPSRPEYAGVAGRQLSWSDMERMHGHPMMRKRRRKKPVPKWFPRKLAEVVTRYVESSAGLRKSTPGDPRERLDRANERLREKRPALAARLKRLCERFNAYILRSSPRPDPRRIRVLDRMMRTLSAQLNILDRAAIVAASCATYYWREKYSSAHIAEKIGIGPSHARTLLWRLRRIGDELYGKRGA